MTTKHHDPSKRKTIKLITGLTGTGLLASMPVLSAASTLTSTTATDVNDTLDCTVICRADDSRAYLLLSNTTDHDIATSRFNSQSILFDNTTLDLADAFIEPVVVPPHERKMVRLNVDSGLHKHLPASNAIDMNANTQYLPLGTRVVSLSVEIHRNVGTITHRLPMT